MKEIRTTKMVEQTTVEFVADDGTKFADEQECKSYEHKQNADKCKADFLRIVEKKIDMPFSDLLSYGCDNDVFLINTNDDNRTKVYCTICDYLDTQYKYMDYYIDENDLKDKNILIVGKDSCYSAIIDYSYFVKELKKAQDLLTADMLEEVAE